MNNKNKGRDGVAGRRHAAVGGLLATENSVAEWSSLAGGKCLLSCVNLSRLRLMPVKNTV